MAEASSILFLALFLALFVAAPALDSPQYTVVHSESDFEVRWYRPSAWMTSQQEDLSFTSATLKGFHRLFQFIQGANLNSSRIPMTAPVLTGIVPSTGPFCSSTFRVRFFLPPQFEKSPPVALPELSLAPEFWPERCIATRSFSGFAKDENVAVEAAKLAASLSKTLWSNATSKETISGVDSYSIAQYDSPFKIFSRHNEVWVPLAKCSAAKNCLPERVADDNTEERRTSS
ncbi:hypothetical protein SELMODRAFT_150839 [Selaginella moellendorffii]|uniref:SOUL heme-binding protein n=1 Tax=Selaginella moellendorffii TaxID=88036 RepID=D8RYM9_SELML|nr:heme-binding protein 2 [Selaginella moellendorffii]EFJ22752.1 hypothetical protein SELMODRAFT_150839 [Selaginella moellendorffii]|eukprot:XP_002975847.1 heme-binding protein 2 [Selaginella moellendorffii]